MAIEEEVVEATTSPTSESTPAPDPAETSSRSDPAQEPQDKRRSELNKALKAEFEKQKREPSAARQAAAAQRAREETTGKFAPGHKEGQTLPAKVEQPAKAAPEATQVPPKEGKSEPAKAPQALAAAPSSLSKETKAIWDTLPEVVRNDIIKREGDTAKGVEQLQARYRPIDEAFQPYRPLLQQYGKTEGEAIHMLFGWHQALANPNPQMKAQAFQALAQSHGFDLSTLAPRSSGQQPQQQQPTDQNDPRAVIHGMVQQALQGYVSPLDQRLSAWEQRLQQEQQSKVNGEIGEFSKDKPYFDKVRTAMGQIMQAGYATSLEDAYNKATWADPEIRAEILATEKAKQDAEAKAAKEAEEAKAAEAAAEAERKRKEALDKARKAGSASPRSSTPSGSAVPASRGGKSVKQSVAEAIREHQRASI